MNATNVQGISFVDDIPIGCIPTQQVVRLSGKSGKGVYAAVANHRLPAYARKGSGGTIGRIERWFKVDDVHGWISEGAPTAPIVPPRAVAAPVLPLAAFEDSDRLARVEAMLARIEQQQDHVITMLDRFATAWGIKKAEH